MCPRVMDAQSLQDKEVFKRDHFEPSFAVFFCSKQKSSVQSVSFNMHDVLVHWRDFPMGSKLKHSCRELFICSR